MFIKYDLILTVMGLSAGNGGGGCPCWVNYNPSSDYQYVREHEDELRELYGDKLIAVHDGEVIQVSTRPGDFERRRPLGQPCIRGTIDEIIAESERWQEADRLSFAKNTHAA